ncbi:hypothetical protein HBA54_27915 [Pelagibius litoralis]|uniref:Methyltransferase domain-containing protein n=1 Tax=Pelagibius litoralis TaxID=374515 RepID=A0A967KGR2_9PROT|nr:hypothetical protein [Pelagibius litoralis]NIA72420.1 hypothetical protein [Pelagibius litoralis]
MRKLLKRILFMLPHQRARKALRSGAPLRVMLGAGRKVPEGWISTNIWDLDITKAASWDAFCRAGQIDSLFCEHVLEHLTPAETREALRLAFDHLGPGGRFRVAVPDGYHPDKGYIDAVKVNGSGPGAADHKVLYTIDSLRPLLEGVGFATESLEFFDSAGVFHEKPWSDEGGRVMRSRRYDPRNTPTEINYSSLIIDALKPSTSIR